MRTPINHIHDMSLRKATISACATWDDVVLDRAKVDRKRQTSRKKLKGAATLRKMPTAFD